MEEKERTDEQKATIADIANAVIGKMDEREQAKVVDNEPAKKFTPGEGEDGKWKEGNHSGEKEGFGTFGEQLKAIAAHTLGQRQDGRLYHGQNGDTKAILGAGETTPSDGGFLVQTEFIDELLRLLHETGRLAGMTRRIPVGPSANGVKIPRVSETSRVNGSRLGGVQAFWESEGQTVTTSKGGFGNLELTLQKLMAITYVTSEMLEDATQIESFVSQGFAEEMGFKLDDAIINGTGAGQPMGILNAGATVNVAKETGQAATTVVFENVLKMRARMWARSRPNSVWLINQDVEPQLQAMAINVGTGGVPVYTPANGIAGSPFDTLFGRPVMPIEQCQTVGTSGDIYLADFSQYLLIEKGGVRAASSIHVQFLTDQTAFRFIHRVNGQPWWESPLTPFKGSNTQSPFIRLAVRA
tara:strand:+ start:7826 stop:9064 length:1239 start_codon:yes stop_codon:yes gene_type:complete